MRDSKIYIQKFRFSISVDSWIDTRGQIHTNFNFSSLKATTKKYICNYTSFFVTANFLTSVCVRDPNTFTFITVFANGKFDLMKNLF